jgi:formylglycine-generating enzyme required for sulfatase activity
MKRFLLFIFALWLGFSCNAQSINDMVFVKGGTFTMGYTSEQGRDYYDNEKPAHQVTVGDFYIGKYPVTQEQWKMVMGSYPVGLHNTGCDDCPVEKVSWDYVQEFIKKLNAQSGKTYRLPTEAEWEYACRGGLQSAHYKYSGSNNIDEVAWYNGNYKTGKHGSQGTTHPVGTKKSNELGIYDMTGNVWEWCNDWYDRDYYSSSPTDNPQGASSGSYHVLRGGGWAEYAQYCRTTYRSSSDRRGISNGFRLVLAP